MLDVHCLCPIIDYRENYLFDTRLKCGSFYDTEKNLLPCLTPPLTFIPFMTLPSI
jgi:hypothetical protein